MKPAIRKTISGTRARSSGSMSGEHHARARRERLPRLEREHPVHDDVPDPARITLGLGVARLVAERPGIEDDEVGPGSDLDPAPLEEPEATRRDRRRSRDRVGETPARVSALER